MGFFGASKKFDGMEREVLSNPTPMNMVSLVERYMAAGEEDKALETAKKAVEKFPNSEKCQSTFQNVRRMQLQVEIQDLNKAIREGGHKKDFERLAEIYHRDLGNRTKAFEIAQEGLAKYQQSDTLQTISGLIRMDRFHQDFLANDFSESIRHFEKAAVINPRNYKALASMGRLYAEAGAYFKAKPVLEQVLKVSPGDEVAERALRVVVSNMGSTARDVDEALSQIESQRGLLGVGLEVRKIFEPSQRGSGVADVSTGQVEKFLNNFESMNGYKCSAVILRDGRCMGSHTRGMVGRERFVRVLQEVYHCCEDASKRMDIGTFVSDEIETSVGRVVMTDWKGHVFGILADVPAKKEDLNQAVEKFIAFLSVG